MLRYTTDRATRPGLVALYDIRPGNGAGQFLQPRSPHGAKPRYIFSLSVCPSVNQNAHYTSYLRAARWCCTLLARCFSWLCSQQRTCRSRRPSHPTSARSQSAGCL